LSIIKLVDQGEEPVALDSNEVVAVEGAPLVVEGSTHEVVQEDMAAVASGVVEEVLVVVAIAVDGKIGKRWCHGSKPLYCFTNQMWKDIPSARRIRHH